MAKINSASGLAAGIQSQTSNINLQPFYFFHGYATFINFLRLGSSSLSVPPLRRDVTFGYISINLFFRSEQCHLFNSEIYQEKLRSLWIFLRYMFYAEMQIYIKPRIIVVVVMCHVVMAMTMKISDKLWVIFS